MFPKNYQKNPIRNDSNCSLAILGICDIANKKFCDDILTKARILQIEKGGQIVCETDVSPSLIIIKQGVLRTLLSTTDGRTQLVAISYQGDVLISPGTDLPWNVKVEASKKSELLLLDSKTMKHIRENVPEIDRQLYFIARQKLKNQQLHALVIAKLKPKERLAYFLIFHCVHIQNNENEEINIMLDVTRNDIAGFLGMESETTSRLFTAFRKEGIIELPRPSIILLKQPDVLKSLASKALNL